MLLIGTQYPGLKSVEWSDWQSANILDYQALLLDCSGAFTPIQAQGLEVSLSVLVGQGHKVFVILPLIPKTLDLNFLPGLTVSVQAQHGDTLNTKNPQPPFDKYTEALNGHDIVFRLRHPRTGQDVTHLPHVVNNVNMLVCAQVGKIYLFHPAARGKSTKALESIVSFFDPDFEECQLEPAPPWGDNVIATIPGIDEVKTRLVEIDGKISELEGQRGSGEKELQTLSEWGQLLWLVGIPLQRVVQKAFNFLGFEIEPRAETGHTEDFVAKHGGTVFLIEATGSAGSITVDKGRQLMEWVVYSEAENCRGVLVGNAFIKDPPEKRPPTPNHHVFTLELERYAKRHGISLLDTRELFRVVCTKLAKQPVAMELICAGLRKGGTVSFPDGTEAHD
jgi:hypothetical protein